MMATVFNLPAVATTWLLHFENPSFRFRRCTTFRACWYRWNYTHPHRRNNNTTATQSTPAHFIIHNFPPFTHTRTGRMLGFVNA